jgi:hypothetical protein
VSHRLQLFDTPESLGESVASFLLEGYMEGEHLLIVAKPRHRDAVLAALRRHGCFPPDGDGDQRLVALDAADVLRHITKNGELKRDLFHRTIKPIVDTLAGTSRRLRIYGELVEVLAEEGNLAGAAALEEMWNELSLEAPFTLMCGYSSAHFAHAHAAPWLKELCAAHSQSCANADVTLGSYLLAGAH